MPSSRHLRAAAREANWRRILADFNSSALGPTDFCRRRGISLPMFHRWRRTIRARDTEHASTVTGSTHSRSTRKNEKTTSADGFVDAFAEVRLSDPQKQQHVLGQNAAIEIALISGIKIRVEENCSMPFLASVLKTLEEERA